MRGKAWLAIASQALILGAPLFAAAGTLRWRAAWVFLAVVIGASALTNLTLAVRDPALLEERIKPLVRRDQPWWDRLLLSSLVLFSIGWLVVMGLDAGRFQWSQMPVWLRLLGVVGIGLGMWIRFRSLRANTFLSTVMKIQEERSHAVISTGPYARIRHPLYAGVLLFFPSTALLLGSWIGVVAAALPILGLIARTALEDRELRRRLDGYTAYAARVRYRLVPGVW